MVHYMTSSLRIPLLYQRHSGYIKDVLKTLIV